MLKTRHIKQLVKTKWNIGKNELLNFLEHGIHGTVFIWMKSNKKYMQKRSIRKNTS